MSHADDMIDARDHRAMRGGPLATPEQERDAAQEQAESYRRQFNAAHNERCRLRNELDALAAECQRLRDELADVRHSEAAFKAGRDEAQERARHHQERRIEALKRAQAAERAAARGGTLRSAVSPRADAADMYRVPGWAVRAYDAHGGAGQVPR